MHLAGDTVTLHAVGVNSKLVGQCAVPSSNLAMLKIDGLS